MKLLKLAEVLEMTGLSRSTIDRLEKLEKFPKRRVVSEKSVAWIESEISEWINNLPSKESE
jgi:prophage regulatory protein